MLILFLKIQIYMKYWIGYSIKRGKIFVQEVINNNKKKFFIVELSVMARPLSNLNQIKLEK